MGLTAEVEGRVSKRIEMWILVCGCEAEAESDSQMGVERLE